MAQNQINDEMEVGTTELIEADKYLKAGAHIGARFKTGEMKKYIYKERKDGLKVLNVQTLDERIKYAANFISQFEPERILIISRKLYAQTAVKKFAEAIGAKSIVGRFVPGTFTNPQSKEFSEVGIILVAEPDSDGQAIKEATVVKAPVVALASTNNVIRNVDFVIPVNNKGRKSLALVYWLLTREVMKNKGLLQNDSDFSLKIEDFEYIVKDDKRKQFGSRGFDSRRGDPRRQRRSFGRSYDNRPPRTDRSRPQDAKSTDRSTDKPKPPVEKKSVSSLLTKNTSNVNMQIKVETKKVDKKVAKVEVPKVERPKEEKPKVAKVEVPKVERPKEEKPKAKEVNQNFEDI